MRGRRLDPGESYAGRRPDVVPINCSIDRQAADLLRQYSGGKKVGAFVSRLVFEFHAREEQRRRVQEALAG